MDQAEGSLKPCIIFAAELRDGGDTILEMHGAIGNLVVSPEGGHLCLENIGSGAALNVRYFFTRPNGADRHWRYLPTMAATGRTTLVESVRLLDKEHVATFEYETMGGRKYRSTIGLNHLVITAFSFEEIKNTATVPAPIFTNAPTGI